jgi:hypothetical protein
MLLRGFQLTLMFVVMTVQAQQFPVAAILRIVVVVMVAMMHCQLGQVGAVEFPLAAPANPGVHFERAFSVALLALELVALRAGDDCIEIIRSRLVVHGDTLGCARAVATRTTPSLITASGIFPPGARLGQIFAVLR